MITLPDSICWLLNIRGGDVPHTPFALAFAILNGDGSTDLFMDARKSSPELVQHLGNAVRLREPAEFVSALDALKGKSSASIPPWGRPPSPTGSRRRREGSSARRSLPTAEGVQEPGRDRRRAQGAYPRRRGTHAVSRLDFARSAGRQLTEIDAAEALEGFRIATGDLSDLSFDSISGAAPHAAIPHYRVTRRATAGSTGTKYS